MEQFTVEDAYYFYATYSAGSLRESDSMVDERSLIEALGVDRRIGSRLEVY